MIYLYRLTMCFTSTEKLLKTTEQLNKAAFSDFDITFHPSINDIATSIPPQYNTFLERDFLFTLEEKPPLGYQFCYVLIKKQGDFVGFMPFQMMHFKAIDSLNFNKTSNPISVYLKKWLARKVEFKTLIVGNLILTGENSYQFEDKIEQKTKENIILKSIDFVIQKWAERSVFIQSIFIKDFYFAQNHLNTEGYNQFRVEPNFIFDIKLEWANFEDYLEALSSKYRIRAKRAFKKINGVEIKEFNEERILANQLNINRLYQNIRSKSAFNMVDLNADYFLQLKRNMGDKFHLWGCFKDGKLISFFTLIENYKHLDAHYLGYEEAPNTEHQLYLNMLFEMIRFGIDNRFEKINFGRTAHEIKSSVGAQAHEMYLYLKNKNSVINRLLPYALNILSPREVWQARQPFK